MADELPGARVELMMLDELAMAARRSGAENLRGYYFRTPKNNMVATHYEKLGFVRDGGEADASEWTLWLRNYQPRNVHIRRSTMGLALPDSTVHLWPKTRYRRF